MSRIDLSETEADFIEFRFADEGTAMKAERCFRSDFVRSGEGIIEYRASVWHIPDIRANLEAAGFTWTEAESGLTEDDMWPEEPGDEEEEEEEEEEDDVPGPNP